MVCKFKDVKSFHKKFITLQEITEQIALPTKTVKLSLDCEGVEPVSGPKIDNGAVWLYVRREITSALYKHLKESAA